MPVIAAAHARPTASTSRSRRARIAIKYMTPVILLSDGYLANGAEPWRSPTLDDAAARSRSRSAPSPTGFQPYLRDRDDARAAVGDAGNAGPRAPHRRAREGGRDRQRQLRAGQPRAHGPAARARRSRASRTTIPHVDARRATPTASCSSSAGARPTARSPRARASAARRRARSVGHVHLRHLNPLPREPGRDARSATSSVLVPEMNLGQLAVAAARRATWSTPIGVQQGPGPAVQGRPRARRRRSQSLDDALRARTR